MTRRVLATGRFDLDVAAQIEWSIQHHRSSWIDVLVDDIATVNTLLGEFPAAGRLRETVDRGEFRQIPLARTPFRVLYRFDPSDDSAPVALLRLFHVREHPRT